MFVVPQDVHRKVGRPIVAERDLQWSLARVIARSIPGLPNETYLSAALAVIQTCRLPEPALANRRGTNE